MAPTSITIVLELEEMTDSPAGRARVPGGPCREFHGWIGLAEAIDSLARTHDLGHAETPHEKEGVRNDPIT